MKDLKFKVWHKKEKRMYYRGYQKLLHVLLCEDDHGEGDGRGKPVGRAPYEDCELLESTSVVDKNRQEIFEGDILRVRFKNTEFVDKVGYVPDMFGSKKIHPLQNLFEKHGIKGNPDNIELEVLGNIFENPELIP